MLLTVSVNESEQSFYHCCYEGWLSITTNTHPLLLMMPMTYHKKEEGDDRNDSDSYKCCARVTKTQSFSHINHFGVRVACACISVVL